MFFLVSWRRSCVNTLQTCRVFLISDPLSTIIRELGCVVIGPLQTIWWAEQWHVTLCTLIWPITQEIRRAWHNKCFPPPKWWGYFFDLWTPWTLLKYFTCLFVFFKSTSFEAIVISWVDLDISARIWKASFSSGWLLGSPKYLRFTTWGCWGHPSFRVN